MPKLKTGKNRKKGRFAPLRTVYEGTKGRKEIDKLLKAGQTGIFNKTGLVDLNLRGYQLKNRLFFRSRLQNVNLRGANLSGSNFKNANVFNVDLRDADLSHADFTGASVVSSGMGGANIEGAILNAIRLGSFYTGKEQESAGWPKGAPSFKKFRGVPAALPPGAKFVNGYIISRGAALVGADLSRQDLRGLVFHGCSFERADFRGSDLSGSSFIHCDLGGANFNKVDLSVTGLKDSYGPIKGKPSALPPGYRLLKDIKGESHLVGPEANVHGITFNDADLSGLSLSTARLHNCHFVRPNVQGARLPPYKSWNGYSMTGVIGYPRMMPRGTQIVEGTLLGPSTRIRDANLSNVNLGRIDLRESRASQVDISGADFSKANLKGATWTSLRGVPKAMPKGMLLVKKPLDTSEWNGIFVTEGSPEATSEHYTFSDPTTNENFRSWFGSSRVASDGKPLIVYHGSRSEPFTAFDLSKIDPHHRGFYFTNDIRIANTYLEKSGEVPDPLVFLASGEEDVITKARSRKKGSLRRPPTRASQGIYRVYLSLKNPYVYEGKGEEWNDLNDPRFPKSSATYELARAVRETGEYDGVIFRNIVDPGNGRGWQESSDVYVAFEPTQVKSALVNDGSYSSTDPDMRKNPRRTSRRKTSRNARRTNRRQP